MSIDREIQRFKDKINELIKEKKREYIQKHGLRVGTIKIAWNEIELPQFEYAYDSEISQGKGGAGDQPGEHFYEEDVSLEDILDILDELKLPRLEPKGETNIFKEEEKWTSEMNSGPESLLIRRRTFKEALKRSIVMGVYNPETQEGFIIPATEDKRYRASKIKYKPEAAAVIIYMMDVSGSIYDAQKEVIQDIVKITDGWIGKCYPTVKRKYIVHDAEAKIVGPSEFFSITTGGGTMISSAYLCCMNEIKNNYPPSRWNIYTFHFSDGDNWPGDTEKCIKILKELVPQINLFCYGQVSNEQFVRYWGSGEFLGELENAFKGSELEDKIRVADINKDLESIKNAIITFFK